jgi:hypothetical protein
VTTVREAIEEAYQTAKKRGVVVIKRFLGQETYHSFDTPELAEQFIKNDIYNNIQTHMAPNVEMPVDVCGVFKFKVTPIMNSYDGDNSIGGTLDYANDRDDTKR